MEWEALRRRLLSGESLDVLAREVLSIPIPYLFRDIPRQMDALKLHLMSTLSLAEADRISIIGSGLTGFSMGPDNHGTPFSENSDVDVVIVSSDLFDSIALRLLEWRYPWHIKTFPSAQAPWAREVAENMLSGSIDPLKLRVPTVDGSKQIPTIRAIVEDWFNSFRSTTAIPALAKREVSGRLYRTREHLIKYQLRSFHIIRNRLHRQRLEA